MLIRLTRLNLLDALIENINFRKTLVIAQRIINRFCISQNFLALKVQF